MPCQIPRRQQQADHRRCRRGSCCATWRPGRQPAEGKRRWRRRLPCASTLHGDACGEYSSWVRIHTLQSSCGARLPSARAWAEGMAWFGLLHQQEFQPPKHHRMPCATQLLHARIGVPAAAAKWQRKLSACQQQHCNQPDPRLSARPTASRRDARRRGCVLCEAASFGT